RLFMDADCADHALGDDRERRQRDDRGCDLVQFVAIVALEKSLLVTEDAAAESSQASVAYLIWNSLEMNGLNGSKIMRSNLVRRSTRPSRRRIWRNPP